MSKSISGVLVALVTLGSICNAPVQGKTRPSSRKPTCQAEVALAKGLVETGRLVAVTVKDKGFKGDPKGIPAGAAPMTGINSRKCCQMKPCDRGPEKTIGMMQNRGVKTAWDIGVTVVVSEKDVELHKFQLEIWSGKNVVFRTKADCADCGKTFKASGESYLFVLDAEAAAEAQKFFQPKNTISLLVSGHNGGVGTFSLVNAAGIARPDK